MKRNLVPTSWSWPGCSLILRRSSKLRCTLCCTIHLYIKLYRGESLGRRTGGACCPPGLCSLCGEGLLSTNRWFRWVSDKAGPLWRGRCSYGSHWWGRLKSRSWLSHWWGLLRSRCSLLLDRCMHRFLLHRFLLDRCHWSWSLLNRSGYRHLLHRRWFLHGLYFRLWLSCHRWSPQRLWNLLLFNWDWCHNWGRSNNWDSLLWLWLGRLGLYFKLNRLEGLWLRLLLSREVHCRSAVLLFLASLWSSLDSLCFVMLFGGHLTPDRNSAGFMSVKERIQL